MEYVNLLRNSLKTVLRNFVAYGIATIILSIGSTLVVTAPPLLYGYISMLVKGTRQEKINVNDIFDGFRSGNFARSWKYMLFVMIIVLLFICALILLIIVGFITFALASTAGITLSESVSIAIVTVIFLIVISIVLIPVFFMLYMLPLYVIKEYDITEAFLESTEIVRQNMISIVMISLLVGIVSLIGVLPYYAGLFLGWPAVFNFLIYTVGVLLTMPFSQQVLVNKTFELASIP
ncbi:MAG: hypothetical protein PWQ63_44 [Methanolobus sp.]|jgi:hypothetical protein|nr:hypothetical protein [Methanolobus sp.]MDK2946884.1 hypothetical protein [Methanolobus sp.]